MLFGNAAEQDAVPPPTAQHLFGYAVHHAVRGRICIERGRFWQAEYWISALRDYALSLASLHHGLETSYARSFDELPEDTLTLARAALARSLERDELLRALAAGVDLLLQEASDVGETASQLAAQLRGLTDGMPR